jgi:hypothetical protein
MRVSCSVGGTCHLQGDVLFAVWGGVCIVLLAGNVVFLAKNVLDLAYQLNVWWRTRLCVMCAV